MFRELKHQLRDLVFKQSENDHNRLTIVQPLEVNMSCRGPLRVQLSHLTEISCFTLLWCINVKMLELLVLRAKGSCFLNGFEFEIVTAKQELKSPYYCKSFLKCYISCIDFAL